MRNKSLILCVLAVLLGSCESNAELKEDAVVIPVTASTPVVKDLTVYLESIGTLKPSIHMEIRPQVSGVLQEVLVTEGQWVQKDMVLFQIDPKPFEIKVQESLAQLTIDKAHFHSIQKKMARYKELAQKDLIAQTEWDDLEAELLKADGVIKLDEARLAHAQLDLSNCLIKASMEGRVGKLDIHPGMLVNNLLPLVTISKMHPLFVEFTLTEKEFSKIPPQDLHIELTSLCDGGDCHYAKVTFMDNHFDQKTGLLFLRGKVSNPLFTLRPGQNVKIKVPVAVNKNVILIPQRAIRYNQEGPYVYVILSDQTVSMRQLILGIEQGLEQVVLQGLDPSEQIVIDGHLRLSPGLKVEIKS